MQMGAALMQASSNTFLKFSSCYSSFNIWSKNPLLGFMASPKHYKILPNNDNLIYSSYSKFLILNSCLVKNSIFYALVVRCGNELTFPLLRIRNMPHLSIKVSPGVKILYVEPKYVKVTNYLVGEEIGKILNPCSFMAFL